MLWRFLFTRFCLLESLKNFIFIACDFRFERTNGTQKNKIKQIAWKQQRNRIWEIYFLGSFGIKCGMSGFQQFIGLNDDGLSVWIFIYGHYNYLLIDLIVRFTAEIRGFLSGYLTFGRHTPQITTNFFTCLRLQSNWPHLKTFSPN